ncbi:MAG: aminopeptidase N [Hyphomicrobiales bacterium]
MRTDTPQPIHLADYRPSPWLIDRVDLDVRLHPTATRIRERLTVRPNPDAGDASDTLMLDGETLTLHSVTIDGETVKPERLTVTDTALTITGVPKRETTVEIDLSMNPEANTALSGLYLSNGIYCTQCEAEGFRRIAYFLDRPDILSRYRVRLEASKSSEPVLLANGNLVEEGDLPDDRHFAVWEDPFPKPSYLFAMVAGRLACVSDTFRTMSGRTVALKIFVEPGKEDRCAFAMESLKLSMAWDERRFGREYDLDVFMIVAVPDFNMGAMENKGLNIFNDKYILALPEAATDQDYANVEGIIAHEYFHNWTGNRITCRDWFQLCLKEGLTVFRDQEFSSDVRSRPVKRIADVRLLRTHQFPEDAGPLAHPVRPSTYIEINNFYTATVYEKGAEICRMLMTLIGEDAFRAGMDLYFERHDGQAVTVEDFIACFADASGRDLTQFFRWYEQAGTPELTAHASYDQKSQTLSLTLSQVLPSTGAQATRPPLHIPVSVGLVGPNGEDLPLDLDGVGRLNSGVIELTERTQTFRFRGLKKRPVPSLNRGFSAPVKLASNLTPGDLYFLMGHDADPFNRWEAGQTVARQLILDAVENAGAGRSHHAVPKLYTDALAASLANPALEPAFVALMLTPPGEGDIAGEIGRNVDTDAIHAAREWLKAGAGGALQNALLEAWSNLRPSEPYSPSPVDSGIRSLRHAALALLAAHDPAQGVALAMEHLARSNNMTDTIGALNVLVQIDCAERDAALDAFYRQHKDDHLLVDKWFALNAQVPSPKAAERVRTLMEHPAFTLARPNRVRALIGSFATMNPVGFNAADGSGYSVLADVVIALDPKNPQVAARLAGNFKSYKVLEPGRRVHAESALKRIAAASPLSRDTFEIVSRTLA